MTSSSGSPDLSWTLNFVRLLRKVGLNHRPLTQAYRGLIESILTSRKVPFLSKANIRINISSLYCSQ